MADTFWITVLGCTAYLAVGFGYVAPRFVTREIDNSAREWPSLAKNPGKIAEWRREFAAFSIPIGLIWPAYLAGRTLIDVIARTAPPSNHELKARNEQQARRIAELEHELGIGSGNG